jgi:hypothetical protein
MDLDDVVGATAIKYADSMGQLPSLVKIAQGHDKLVAALGGVRGIRLTMHVKDRIIGELTADFEQDVSALGDQAKPFVVDVLTLADVYEPTVEQWEFRAEGNKIVGKGPMEPEALGRLLAVLSPAGAEVASATSESAGGASQPPNSTAAGTQPPPPASDPQNEAAQASQRYYKAIASILDGASRKPSPTQGASWLTTKARVIEQLPILNVDPALVEWGSVVSNTLKRAGQELALGQQKAMVAAQGVASPTAYSSYTSGNEYSTSDTPETRAAYRNAQQQRQQVAQAERGAAAERALAIINDVLPTRAKIRADMVQKYGVEF